MTERSSINQRTSDHLTLDDIAHLKYQKIYLSIVCNHVLLIPMSVSSTSHLHLNIKDSSFLLDPLFDGSHGLVEHGQSLCALQCGRGHDVPWWCDQVDLYMEIYMAFLYICHHLRKTEIMFLLYF